MQATQHVVGVQLGRGRRPRPALPPAPRRPARPGFADRDAELLRPGQQGGSLGHDHGAALDLAGEDLAGRAVDRDRVAGLEETAADRYDPVTDLDLACAHDGRDPELAGNDRGVRGRAARGGQDALGDGHAVDVVRARLGTCQDHPLARLRPPSRRRPAR